MKFSLSDSTFAPVAKIQLQLNEQIRIEPGAMVYHKNVELEGRMNANGKKGFGGALSALGRSVTSGESVFISTATGRSDQAEITVAPAAPGKIFALSVGAEHWRLNSGAFLASDQSVNYQMKRQRLSGALLGGTGGLFVMETFGEGDLLVAAFGDIEKVDVTADEPVVIDNQHVIAWTSSLDYEIKVASGTFGFKTGEGVVNEFHGNGSVYIQTRNLETFAHQLSSFIPQA